MEKPKATPAARRLAKLHGIDLNSIGKLPAAGYFKAKDVLAMSAGCLITPAAKKLMQSFALSPGDIPHAGRRIYKSDVLAAKAAAAGNAAVIRRFPAIKRVTAKRMLASHVEIPPVTLNMKADVTAMLQARRAFNEAHNTKITINDYIVHATAQALREYPEANASYSEEGMVMHSGVHIATAVALEYGLVVPVVRNADTLSLMELSGKIKGLAAAAREGKLPPDAYEGSTFTVSNLGMFGVTSFTPIINQPNSMILGVCAVENVLKLDEGVVSSHDVLTLCLTFDHRMHDGAQAAKFLRAIVEKLEEYA